MRTREGMAVAKAKGKLKGKQPKLTAAQQKLAALGVDAGGGASECAPAARV